MLMKLKKMMMLMLVASITVVGGCTAQPGPEASAEKTADQGTASAAAQPAGNTFVGTVAETMDAGTYTYVRVENEDGEIWAAAGRFDVAVGDRVTVPLEMAMESFHSDTLDRDFEVIYFAQHIAREGEAPAAATMPAGHPPVTGAAASHGTMELPSVDSVEGGVTVGAIWTDREQLAGTTVTVRGQVVKFNGGILGTNWIHIQDGTGDPEAGTHDVTVTSNATASVGDVITVTGPVVVDQDFGAGYRYPVLIKDAQVVAR
jgi:hypothetical protein